MVLGLTVKVLSERPWEGLIVPAAALDIGVVPMAHAAGALAGVAATLLMALLARVAPRRVSGSAPSARA
jgi:hypothetical protein